MMRKGEMFDMRMQTRTRPHANKEVCVLRKEEEPTRGFSKSPLGTLL